MTRTFSDAAHSWLRNYHGSIDATALLLAYEAGQRGALEGARAELIARQVDAYGIVLPDVNEAVDLLAERAEASPVSRASLDEKEGGTK